MVDNLTVTAITSESEDWTCKVQIVDIFGPAESPEKKVKYLNLIIQDEQENQVKATVFGDDIPSYQDLLKLYHTYYITGAKVQASNFRYEIPLHTFEWILDKKTILDPVESNGADVLPPPTKLMLASVQQIKDHVLETADNVTHILAVVINCAQPRYVESLKKRLQDLIVMDVSRQILTFTLWEETLIDNEGRKLLEHFHEYPIILARRIGGSKFNGVSLTSKYNTTIQIDPPYPQRQQFHEWVIANRQLLTSLTLRSTSESGSVIPVLADEELVQITNINSQQDGCIFLIEAKISFAAAAKNLYRNLYVLRCINCPQEVRYNFIREIRCLKCHQIRKLVPRCRFEVNLEDSSGSTIGLIMGKAGENLLGLTVDQIYERAVAQKHLETSAKTEESHHAQSDVIAAQIDYPSLEDIERSLKHKIFEIRAKKIFTQTSYVTSAKIFIQSCVEKQIVTQSETAEGSQKKKKLDLHEMTGQSESLKLKQWEPTTPGKSY